MSSSSSQEAAGGSSAAAAAPPVPLRVSKMQQAFAMSLKAWRAGVPNDLMESCFPSIYAKHPDAMEEMISSFWENIDAFAKDELNKLIGDDNLAAKVAELESIKLRQAGAARPEALDLMPLEEMRSLAVEAKLAHEAGLKRLLEEARRENSALETSIEALDGRARKVQSSINSRMEEFAEAAEACTTLETNSQ